MIAGVLTLLWRQVPSVNELNRMLAGEDLLWCSAVQVSQQALSKRFLELTAVLFERGFLELLPQLRRGWCNCRQRPKPISRQWTKQRFNRIWVVDGSTLEALFRDLKSWPAQPTAALAGKIYTIVD